MSKAPCSEADGYRRLTQSIPLPMANTKIALKLSIPKSSTKKGQNDLKGLLNQVEYIPTLFKEQLTKSLMFTTSRPSTN